MLRFVVVAIALCFSIAGTALAESKLALVIGNGAYINATSLPNPPNDAADMASTLSTMGFDVVSAINASKVEMDGKIREFAEKAETAEVTLFFYAGHGMQVNGANYLIPIDAKLQSATALDFETVNAENVIRYMSSDTRSGLVFLDACRDNPLSRSFQKKSRSTAVGSGLASRTTSDQNLLIAYATSPGQTAQDGNGRNSPFTAALLKHLPMQGDDVQSILTDAMGDVQKSTQGEQVPWSHSSFTRKVFLNGTAATAPTEKTDPVATEKSETQVAVDNTQAEARAAWDAVKDSSSIAALETVANRYSGSIYAELAAARAKELREEAEAEKKRKRDQAAKDAAKRKLEAEKAKRDAEQAQQQEQVDEPQQTDEPPSVAEDGGNELRWGVIFAAFPKSATLDARAMLKNVRNFGWQAELIDSNKYGRLTRNLWVVVIKADSRGSALSLQDDIRNSFPDAYAKQLK
jgi:uncharacterized caspase-like protein